MNDTAGKDLISAAQAGDRPAFDRLAQGARRRLDAYLWRMVGQREDCEDLAQAALMKAWAGIGSFDGRSSFATWLLAIAHRLAVDHLRGRRRWRRESQIAYANQCAGNEAWQGEIMAVLAEPDFAFDAREHVAYCFVCLGRSLPPDEQAALVLRDVMEFSAREAADVLGTSDSVLRHRLAAARRAMEERYEGLCALVSKTGMCRQCSGIGEAARAVGGKALPLPDIDGFAARLAVVRGTDPAARRNRALHEVFFRRTAEVEAAGVGATVPDDCS